MAERGPRTREDPFPRRIEPMLPTTAHKIPEDHQNWISEPVIPGIRVIAYVGPRIEVKILTRQNNNITTNFAEISQSLTAISRRKPFIFDGSIVCANNHLGQNAAEQRAKQTPTQRKLNPIGPCFFAINDILYANGQNLMSKSLEERKALLGKVLPKINGFLAPVPYSTNDHRTIRKLAKGSGLKEVSYRKKGVSYKQGVRSKDWLRVKIR